MFRGFCPGVASTCRVGHRIIPCRISFIEDLIPGQFLRALQDFFRTSEGRRGRWKSSRRNNLTFMSASLFLRRYISSFPVCVPVALASLDAAASAFDCVSGSLINDLELSRVKKLGRIECFTSRDMNQRTR